MSLRTTNNSLAASLDAALQGLPDEQELPASLNAAIFPPSLVSEATIPLHQAGLPDVPSPAFLASVVAAVKQPLAADWTATSVQASSSTQTSVAGAIGGVPTTVALSQHSLHSQASAFAASGVGFPTVPVLIAGPVASSQDLFCATRVFSRSYALERRHWAFFQCAIFTTGADFACPAAAVHFATELFTCSTKAGEPDRFKQVCQVL